MVVNPAGTGRMAAVLTKPVWQPAMLSFFVWAEFNDYHV